MSSNCEVCGRFWQDCVCPRPEPPADIGNGASQPTRAPNGIFWPGLLVHAVEFALLAGLFVAAHWLSWEVFVGWAAGVLYMVAVTAASEVRRQSGIDVYAWTWRNAMRNAAVPTGVGTTPPESDSEPSS